MQDISAILKETSNKNECSVFNALLILLQEKEQEEEDVCLLQSESRGKTCRRLRN